VSSPPDLDSAGDSGNRARRGRSELETLLVDLEKQGIKPGLAATRRLAGALDNPEKRFPIVLVGGTNGKGSAATLLAAIAVAGGHRTGLYTSPHLESPRERIRIDGRAVSEGEMLAALRKVVSASGRVPTYFEAMTIAAFLLFAAKRIDIAVVEVGLGGRLDATNITEPELSIVTSIGLDHTEYLGERLGQIAAEKAGIFRRGRIALCGPTESEAAEALERLAVEVGADYQRVDGETVGFEVHDADLQSQRLALQTLRSRYEFDSSLIGRHQLNSLRLAVVAAESLEEAGWRGFDSAAITRGVEGARWPGRLEWIPRPDREGFGVLLDAAHNPSAIEALCSFLSEVEEGYELLFGALSDRPASEMLDRLGANAGRVTLTRPDSPRAWWDAAEREGVDREPSIEEALDRALELQSEPLLVVSGSIFLIGPVRGLLAARWPHVAPAPDVDVARGSRTDA